MMMRDAGLHRRRQQPRELHLHRRVQVRLRLFYDKRVARLDNVAEVEDGGG